jgi:hypothetical protein
MRAARYGTRAEWAGRPRERSFRARAESTRKRAQHCFARAVRGHQGFDVQLRGELEVRLFTMLSQVGAAQDVTAAELHIESLMPADGASEAVLRGLAR